MDISESFRNSDLLISNGQKAATLAIGILVNKDPASYKDLTKQEKKSLIMAFASKDI